VLSEEANEISGQVKVTDERLTQVVNPPGRSPYRKSTRSGLRLTGRDLDLLRFLHDQQFASLAMLYYRFFDRRASASDPIPTNCWVTRQRLAALKQAGLICSQRVYTEGKALYLLTRAGYEVVRQKRELWVYEEPAPAIDFRYYEHDKRVSMCRVALEREGKAVVWHPERYLRRRRGLRLPDGGWMRFAVGTIPDGVFVSSKNQRVALELELTPKTRERYRAKLEAYLRMFAGEGVADKGKTGAGVELVVFIACTDRIGKDLQEIFYPTVPSDLFIIRSYESLVGGALGKEALL
jgi:hypothetical protein